MIFCQLTVFEFLMILEGNLDLVVNGFSGSGVWVRVELSLLK